MTRIPHSSFRYRAFLAPVLAVAVAAPAVAQTRIELHKNSYSPKQDVELGQQAAAEVRQQMPMLNDERVEDFAERVGERLIAAIPSEYRQPEFRYSFDVVNLREINAFALPGGPMFLHRGMIEAARSEAEVAGVMGHEIAHVVLRHGTAQATKGQKFQLGALAGQVLGAVIGGRTGAVVSQGSQIGLGTVFLKYSREYEREADLLGAQLMARAGYDPRAMASMFQTIEKQGGGGGPEFLSDHPNPGNRVQAINREAAMLQVQNARGGNGDIESVHARLRQMSPAPTSAQVAQSRQGQQGGRREPVGTSGRNGRVELPSGEWRTYQPGDFLRISVPANWEQIGGGNTVTFAPDGGYVRAQNGQSAFTHGIEVGVTRGNGSNGSNLQQQTEQLLQSFAQSNPQLRRQGGYARTSVGGRRGLTTTLSNVSEVTGETEAVNVSTVQLRDGSVLFLIGVAPADEARTYLTTFNRIRQNVQLADQR
jgi:Zn-dependent protease with chaperone function